MTKTMRLLLISAGLFQLTVSRAAAQTEFNPARDQVGALASTYSGYGAFYMKALTAKHNVKGTFAFYLYEKETAAQALERSFNGALGLEYQYDVRELVRGNQAERLYFILGGSWYQRYQKTDVSVGEDPTDNSFSYRGGIGMGLETSSMSSHGLTFGGHAGYYATYRPDKERVTYVGPGAGIYLSIAF